MRVVRTISLEPLPSTSSPLVGDTRLKFSGNSREVEVAVIRAFVPGGKTRAISPTSALAEIGAVEARGSADIAHQCSASTAPPASAIKTLPTSVRATAAPAISLRVTLPRLVSTFAEARV